MYTKSTSVFAGPLEAVHVGAQDGTCNEEEILIRKMVKIVEKKSFFLKKTRRSRNAGNTLSQRLKAVQQFPDD